MDILLLRILFFGLIPIGIFIILRAIQLLRKTFNGKIVTEIPYSQNSGGQFSVENAGYFSVWHKGQILKRTPIDKLKLHIHETSTNKEIKLQPSILSPRTNNFTSGRMEIYRFYAPVGNYQIEFKEGSNVSKLQSLIADIVPLPSVDPSQYFIEIRQSPPQLMTILAIPMLFIGIAGTVGGLILAIKTDKIFN